MRSPRATNGSGRRHRRSVSTGFVASFVAAAAMAATSSGCNGSDDVEPDTATLVATTIDQGGARYAVTVRQGSAPTIAQVALDATGPTVWGETDFGSGRRHLHIADISNPSAVVDGDQVFARPGHEPTEWGVAVIDDDTLAALDLSQLIALHDPGTLLRALADVAPDAQAHEASSAAIDDGADSTGPGHHTEWGIPIDRLDDPVTAGLAARLGMATVEIHVWSSDGDPSIRRIAMPLGLGVRSVADAPHGPVPPDDRDFTDEPAGPPTPDDHAVDDAPESALRPETTMATPESWLVVDLLDLGEHLDPDFVDSLAPSEPLRPEDLASRLTFEPFTGLADLADLPDTLVDSPVPGAAAD